MATEPTFPVVEIFGPTIQGEGPQVGMRCSFVRFGGCDFRCSWCDSSHAVLPEQVRQAPRMTAGAIVDQVPDAPLVILSGGNPLLHDLAGVVVGLHVRGMEVAVETQGTMWKPWINMVNQVVVSPKPPSSGMADRFVPGLPYFLRTTTSRVAIKVPCFDRQDVQFAGDIAASFPQFPFFVSVVTLMGGLDGTFAGGAIDSNESLLARYRLVLDWVNADPRLYRARVLPQLHALAWGHERGH